ncbi:LAFE_0E00518g1_1 [Lachancea fermentati]|uniref:LAFE_0E00518g1_1 n=1 Tax=Lachancea fermentati TaxID=4955 RepID=A0A1G4MC76_LACFM|nr:LAFE_0E00518g1_1 [Lachancea fermentati]
MAGNRKDIAALIVGFLNDTIKTKEVSEDYVDSLNVAIDCIAEAFEFDKETVGAIIKKSFDGRNLEQLLSGSTDGAEDLQKEAVTVNIPVEDAETKAKAEELKALGNKAMAAKDFELAITKYTEAIEALPTNAVYYANRAAAYSSLKRYEEAVKDAESAIEVNPSYSKGYSRLGFAMYALGKPEEALGAYKKVLDIEGEKATDAMKRDYETAKKKVEQSLDLEKSSPAQSQAENNSGGFPDMSSLLGGGLGGLLNNPQVMQAAQQMMQNPNAFKDLMSNPAVKQMADKFSSGGGAPNMSDLMNDPALRDMAKNMFGPK